MAYIRVFRGQWRAEVQKSGIRKSKLLPTYEEAKEWAAYTERQLEGARARFLAPDDLKSIGLTLSTAMPVSVLNAVREIPHSIHEVLLASVPMRHGSGIYFLLRNKEVVYVGQSVDVLGRISRHRREGRAFDAYAYIDCAPEEMDRLERLYIRAFVPEENMSLGNKDRLSCRPRRAKATPL